MTSRIDLGTMPGGTDGALAELADATDAPDDPSLYLVDRLVAALPDGSIKTAAQLVAPLVAAYLDEKIDDIAPHFSAGVRTLGSGLAQIATRFDTLEVWTVAQAGGTGRAIVGLRFELPTATTDVAFAGAGQPDVTAQTQVTLDALGQLAVEHHAIGLAYGEMLRIGLDRAVIPTVDPAASDLATALTDLVDCKSLGALVADKLGIGTASLYESACGVGLTAAADELYAKLATLDAAPLELDLAGLAVASDGDDDGVADTITGGTWTGSASYAGAPLAMGLATFDGKKQ
ncbi:MAG TPA: hypothetical protein VLX92_08990 [Kofleriaceae bacterium]|nr:hypothetical protein [Kofleriaceae bacterium]